MKRTFVLAALTLAAVHPAAAQLRIPPVRLIAGIGPTANASYGLEQGDDGKLYVLNHAGSTAAQLGLETTSPIRGVDLRLNFQYWKPMMRLGQIAAAGDPGEPYQEVYRTSVKTLTLDANIHLPRVLDMRPYALAGVGITRYDFKDTYYHDSNQPLTPADRTRPTLNLGLGTAWNVGRYDLFIEYNAFLTRNPSWSVEGVKVTNDQNATITAGIRVPIHR